MSFSRTAHEEVAKLANEEGLEIGLIPSDDLIRDAGNTSKSKPEKALERSRKVVPKRKDRRKKTTKSS